MKTVFFKEKIETNNLFEIIFKIIILNFKYIYIYIYIYILNPQPHPSYLKLKSGLLNHEIHIFFYLFDKTF